MISKAYKSFKKEFNAIREQNKNYQHPNFVNFKENFAKKEKETKSFIDSVKKTVDTK